MTLGGVAFWWLPDAEPLPAQTQPIPAPPPMHAAPAPAPPLLDQAGILTHVAREPTALRWAANPRVWVLDFPTLASQGGAFNRAAALLEKAATPRDRILDDAALAAAIAADRRTPEDWYFGHNYRLSDLERMFALADAASLRLNPTEAWLREHMTLARRLEPGVEVAVLGIPAIGPRVDAAMRASILRHELAHGQFFTMPLFAAHVMAVWQRGFTEAERRAMRDFLARDGYDTAQEEMMANEAMAYLLHTPDRRFFDPARDLGWSDAQADRIRALLSERAPDQPGP
ncbi:MAG: hypothetical protein NTW56_12515 [Alphaproteobacteria bacterium]|nr:hypothetical protein [Alphaproteobacteria bacterium]